MLLHHNMKKSNIILYCKDWRRTVGFYRLKSELPVNFSTDWFVEFRLTDNSYLSIADEESPLHEPGGIRDVGTWWDANWSYRKKITVDHDMVDVDLENFPVLFHNISLDFVSHAQDFFNLNDPTCIGESPLKGPDQRNLPLRLLTEQPRRFENNGKPASGSRIWEIQIGNIFPVVERQGEGVYQGSCF